MGAAALHRKGRCVVLCDVAANVSVLSRDKRIVLRVVPGDNTVKRKATLGFDVETPSA